MNCTAIYWQEACLIQYTTKPSKNAAAVTIGLFDFIVIGGFRRYFFHSAGVFFRLGDVEHTSTEPLILLVPPEVPHGFLFADDVVGDVLSLRIAED